MKQKTVYVIGAGASKEANLPTGHELKDSISDLLDMRFDHSGQLSGDHLIADALRVYIRELDLVNHDINPYLYGAWHIRDALPQAISIDNFIDTHRDNDKIAICGKLAIVRSILNAENNSLLKAYNDQGALKIKLRSLETTWYGQFFKLLTENCSIDDLEDRLRSISLIIFNYDRCIEHFMYHALQNYYGIPAPDAAQLISCMNIFHPYGSVGSLPWFPNADGDSMGFGDDLYARDLLQLAKKIKTFAEGTDPESSEISAIREDIKNARKLVFLGFAFHKLNMQLITPDGLSNCNSIPPCYATTLNISESDKNVVKKQIFYLYNPVQDKGYNLWKDELSFAMSNMQCANFFSEYWRSLAF